MKRGLIILLILILIVSIGCDRIHILSQTAEHAQFAKLITTLHLTEETGFNLPYGAAMPMAEGSSSDQYIGNFFLTADVYGDMQKLLVEDDEGVRHEVEVYKLEKLKVNMKPKALYGVSITHNDVTAGAWASDTRVKFTDVSFAKYTQQGDTIIHEEYPDDADTTTGNKITETIYFEDLYVPPNFKLTMRFNVGEAGSQDDVRTPAILGSYVPAIVEWKPFPDAVAGGEDPSLGSYQGKVVGYVSDTFTKQPMRDTEMTIDDYPSPYLDTTKTNTYGYYEFIVPLETDFEQTEIYPRHYTLNLKGCDHNCKYQGIYNVKDLFKQKHGITDFDYNGGLHYPLPEEETNVWIEVNNRLFFRPVWVRDVVRSRHMNHHDFYVQPAPPGAYLRTNKESYGFVMMKTNEPIEFEGFGVEGVADVVKWTLDFGDGTEVSGTGDHTKQEHKYTEPGNYTAAIKFGSDYFWSPPYTQTIRVEKAMSHAYLKIIPFYLWLNKTATGEFIPATITIKGSASASEGNKAVGWILEPDNITGTGDSFEIKKTIDEPGNYTFSAKFKDEHGAWGYGISDSITVRGREPVTPEKKYDIQSIPDEYGITVKNRKIEFRGWAENVGYSPYDDEVDLGLIYKWDFNGDGIFEYKSKKSNEKVYHTYRTPGIYNVTFEVEDPDGYKESESFLIEVINVYATFEMLPSNVVEDRTVIDAWYTLHNKWTKDIDVERDVLYWEHSDNGNFYFSHYEYITQPYTGIVKAGESKELWRERETVCCPGVRRGVARIHTEYGEVRTSLTKTILPSSQPQNQTPAPVPSITIASAKNKYNPIEPITVTLTSNTPNTPCTLKYAWNTGSWVTAGTSTTNNNGATQFTRANNPVGTYKAKAICNNVESNELIITVSLPTIQYWVNLAALKSTYDYDKLVSGEDHIQFNIDSNMPNAFCDFYSMNIAQGDWSKKDTIALHADGKVHVMMPSRATGYFIPGIWESQVICKLTGSPSVQSNKVRHTVVKQTPQRQLPVVPDVKMPSTQPIEKTGSATESVPIQPITKKKLSAVGIKKLSTRAVTELNRENINKSAILVTLLLVLFIICSRLDKK